MVTKELVKSYCEKFGLTYVEAPNVPLDDKDEWLDTVCAGFHYDPHTSPWGCFCVVQVREGNARSSPRSVTALSSWKTSSLSSPPPTCLLRWSPGTPSTLSESSIPNQVR